MNQDKINELSKSIHAHNVSAGWWPKGRCPYQTIQLINTEVAEATEGDRKDLMDDKLTHRKMEEVELADTLIRLLDFGGKYDYTYTHKGLQFPLINAFYTNAARHFAISCCICDFGKAFYVDAKNEKKDLMEHLYGVCIEAVLQCASVSGYDIETTLEEKLEVNKTRADHKIENRQKANGKSY